MESSSEDNFAWTSASSDTDRPASDVEMAHEEELDSGKAFKKKLKKELLLNGDQHEHNESTDEKRRKKVKREKKSQSPSPARGRDGRGSSADAEHMLRLKVKQERAGLAVSCDRGAGPRDRGAGAGSPPASPRNKRRRRDSDGPSAGDEPKKKKKKRKRENSEASHSIDETREPVVDKFEAEETVVEARRPEPNVNGHVKSKSAPEKPFTSKEFVDDDDDSSADEGPPAAPAAAPRRALRISERITFEEEAEAEAPPPSSSPSPSPAPSAPSAAASRGASPARADGGGGRLGRFLRAHAHMRPVLGAGAGPAAADVGPDDELWLVHCPRDLPAGALLGAALDAGARRKLSAGGRSYEAAPVEGVDAEAGTRVALLVRGAAGCVVRGVRLRGALRLRERVPRVRAPPPSPPPRSPERIPLPDTRARHPLLGADYERAARLPPAVRRRLRAAAARDPVDVPARLDDAPDRREKKKKKKKHRERPDPDAPEPEPEPEPESVSRKRKRSSRNEPEEPSENEDSRKSKKKKKEKTKRRRDDAALWDSERAIEQSLFGR